MRARQGRKRIAVAAEALANAADVRIVDVPKSDSVFALLGAPSNGFWAPQNHNINSVDAANVRIADVPKLRAVFAALPLRPLTWKRGQCTHWLARLKDSHDMYVPRFSPHWHCSMRPNMSAAQQGAHPWSSVCRH